MYFNLDTQENRAKENNNHIFGLSKRYELIFLIFQINFLHLILNQ